MKFLKLFLTLLWIVIPLASVLGQKATVKEELLPLDTYGFGKPNPVPILVENPKIFPYFKFEEYEHTSQKKAWKVVTLENDYIKIMVLPEIGGKVWGAIEKSTGEEFLYKNEVIKFRNIAMRGPWTSGGIEFNFGIIGHHPSTASPVDYITRTNEDGSVSCIVGSNDLPSDTQWRVEIRLEKDKAYFETNASWYNASPLPASYYNWMTAAAVATYDLEFFIPGNTYVEHGGKAHNWPIDDMGRDLSFYKNNTFGPSKSYHVVGEYNDFFGGYYHDRKFGFGQWAPYEEMPGQKLWLWDLSRSGGIWEDLLTDSNGQYIEFQAGRLFDQYSPDASANPISQVGFDPYMMDNWHEIWFPYKEIGGMVDASEQGVLNVEMKGNETYIGLNALQKLATSINISINGKIALSERVDLQPMEVYGKTLATSPDDKITVEVVGTELGYNNDPDLNLLKRPFYPDENLRVSTTEQLYQKGCEAIEFREYALAWEKLSALVKIDPSHREALAKLAELAYRKADYDLALVYANTVLKMDTYNAAANYIAGIAYRALGDITNALEALGWSARDIKYRSVSFAQMAEIYLSVNNMERADTYAQKALDFNSYNLNARKILAVVARKKEDAAGFQKAIADLLNIDPLSHFAEVEKSFFDAKTPHLKINNEFPLETMLTLALDYHHLGMADEAIKILSSQKKGPKSILWQAYLSKDSNPIESTHLIKKAVETDVELVFPFRKETIPVLEWALLQDNSWKLHYYLAQNFIAVGQRARGTAILRALGNTPDSDIFYRFRAALDKDREMSEREADYETALRLNSGDWKVWEENILFQLENKAYTKAINTSKKGYKKFPGNYNIGLAHAKSLLNMANYSEVIKVLKNIQVLPYEHASESRSIYVRAYVGEAISKYREKNYSRSLSLLDASKKWPENIGVGKPYDPDERLQDFLMAMCYGKSGNHDKEVAALTQVAVYTNENGSNSNLNQIFGLVALKRLGNEDDYAKQISELEKAGSQIAKNKLILALIKDEQAALQSLKAQNEVSMELWEAINLAMGH